MLKPWEIDRRTGTSYKKTGTTNRSTQSAALSRFKDQVGMEWADPIDTVAINRKYLQQLADANAAKEQPAGQPASQPSSATNDAVAALLSQPAAPAAQPAPYVDPYADARAEAQRAAEARRQFLNQWASGARMTMNQSADNAAAILAAQVNPYEQIQMIAPSVVP